MRNMQAEPGENIYHLVQRTISLAAVLGEITATHNGISVRIYPESYEYDILEKFELNRRIVCLKA